MLTNKSDGIQLPFTLRNENASGKAKLSSTAKRCITKDCDGILNPFNTELNLICHLLALLGAQQILHVSRIRVKQRERNSDDGSFRTLKK